MLGNESVNIRYIVLLILCVIVYYGLLLNGWGERIEWLQSLSIGYEPFLMDPPK